MTHKDIHTYVLICLHIESQPLCVLFLFKIEGILPVRKQRLHGPASFAFSFHCVRKENHKSLESLDQIAKSFGRKNTLAVNF